MGRKTSKNGFESENAARIEVFRRTGDVRGPTQDGALATKYGYTANTEEIRKDYEFIGFPLVVAFVSYLFRICSICVLYFSYTTDKANNRQSKQQTNN